jgi:hypothetical protein
MKIFLAYTVFVAFLMVAIGVGITFCTPGIAEEAWTIIGATSFCVLGVPWVVFISFLFLRYAVYEIRKAWLKAEEDAKGK